MEAVGIVKGPVDARRVAHTTRFSLCGDFMPFGSYANLIRSQNPTQAKTGLEWATARLN
jgi:hypothetical protein